MKSLILRSSLLVLTTAILFAGDLFAADHYNLEEGLPTELTDSIAIGYREREVQGFFRWEHTGEGEEKFLLVPRLEYGL